MSSRNGLFGFFGFDVIIVYSVLDIELQVSRL